MGRCVISLSLFDFHGLFQKLSIKNSLGLWALPLLVLQTEGLQNVWAAIRPLGPGEHRARRPCGLRDHPEDKKERQKACAHFTALMAPVPVISSSKPGEEEESSCEEMVGDSFLFELHNLLWKWETHRPFRVGRAEVSGLGGKGRAYS